MKKTTLWIDALGWPVLAWVGGPRTLRSAHLYMNEENYVMNWCSWLTSSCMSGRTYNIHLHIHTCMQMRKTALWIDVLCWPVLAQVEGPTTYTCTDAPACEWGKPPYELTFLADQFLHVWEELGHTQVCTPACEWGKPPYELTFSADQFLHVWEELGHTQVCTPACE